MRIITYFIAAVASLIFSGCATDPTSLAEARQIAARRVFRIPTASHRDRAAQVTIVRDSGAMGSAISTALRMNGRPIASFRVRESLTFSLDPGDYVFGLEPSLKLGAGLKEYSLTAKAGEHYFYRISVTNEGFFLQRSYEINR